MQAAKQSARQRGYSASEMVVVIMFLGLVGAVVVPQFTRAGVATHEQGLKDQLRTVRAAVELYRAQHHDAAPDLSRDWTPLMKRSDENGRLESNGGGGEGTAGTARTAGETMFGPYLPTPPVNPLTGGSKVSDSPDRGVDWWWDSSTGSVTALDRNGGSYAEAQ